MISRLQGRLAARAPAKINLSLRVLGRRPDGYHELDSIVAFAGCHDLLVLDPGEALALSVDGAPDLAAGNDNLVLKAAKALASRVSGLKVGHFTLTKRLPIAAGLGGGSSDAAAALRLLAQLNGLAVEHPSVMEAAAVTGADVPVCLSPRLRRMRGIGHDVGPRIDLPMLPAVLVNPGIPLETSRVFAQLNRAPGDIESTTCSIDAPVSARDLPGLTNDLEPPARKLAPQIDEVLAALSATDEVSLVRMSGSGPTCFALYPDRASARRAARKLAAQAPPEWWIRETPLR